MLGCCWRSSGRRAGRSAITTVVMALLLLAVAGSTAQAKLVYHHGKPYGELPKPGAASTPPPSGLSPSGSPFTVGGPQPPLTYGGGPVMLSSKVYLIFWGPSGSFASTYSSPIIQYAKDLQTDHLKTTNEFSVGQQYYEGTSVKHFITNNVSFGGAIFDTTPYPAIDTSQGCSTAERPCVTDEQIQNEILNDINNQGWPTDPPSAPEAQYLLFTPNGTNSCDAPGDCTFSSSGGFCAYHGQITGITPGNQVATYSNMPYESGCDSGEAPAGTDGNADTDGTLDSGIHELLESATDPAGNAWLDSNGQEIADKCTFPVVTTQPATYGTPLGGTLAALNAFNQLIGGHTYYTQQIWSNAPTKTPSTTAAAGCVQRIGPSPSFTAPTAAQHTGTAVSFPGSASSEVANPISAYVWSYGDGSPTTTGSTGSHTYYKAGTYVVSLTVSDSTGATNASIERRAITVTGATLAPTISSFSPATGVAGTTVVTIHGTNIAGATVKFNGVVAPAQTDTATQITVTAPNGITAGKITVTTGGGTATSAAAFTPTLSLSSFSPASGPAGTTVTIDGVGFNASSKVTFNGVAASSVTHTSTTVLKAVVPASATSGPIVITNTAAPVGHTQSRTAFTKT